MISLSKIRQEFPFLQSDYQNGQPLIYFDNASSTQKPKQVLSTIQKFYEEHYANIHRGVYTRAMDATEFYNTARMQVASFLNAKGADEIVFTRGTTESVNLIANAFLKPRLKPGDNVVITEMEHHSNLVPWQQICMQQQAELRVIPVNEKGELELMLVDELLDNKTKLLSFSHISNTLGTVNPVRELQKKAEAKGIPVFLDAAQSASCLALDVQDLGIDFLAFSGHKLYGPSGIGALYIQSNRWVDMRPYQFGGDMIRSVSFTESTFKEGPQRYEAGTPNITGAIGMARAIEFLQDIGMKKIWDHGQELRKAAELKLKSVEGLRIIGEAENKAGVISFAYKEVHPHDVASIFDYEGIAIRAGHHCTEPLMKKYNLPGTARISFGVYNELEELKALDNAILRLRTLFG